MTVETKLSPKGVIVWLVCALFFMYEFLLRTSLGTFQIPLSIDLQLTPVRFALLSSTAYQLIYGLMQIPVGVIVEQYGLKKTLFVAVFVCAIATFGFSVSHYFSSAVVFRVLMGLGSAFGFVCLLYAVYEWMPRRYIAFFIGLSQLVGTLGPMLAAGPLNMLAESSVLSWRTIFAYLGVIGCALAFAVLLLVEKNRQTQGKFKILARPMPVSVSLKRILIQKQTWLIAIFSSCAYFAIEYLSENEGILFLKSKGFSSTLSSYMISVAWLGYALSCPLLGLISDWIERRKPVMIACSLILLVVLTVLIYLPMNAMATAICFFFLGTGASGQSLGFAIMAEYCKEDNLAIGLGLNNAFIVTLSAIGAPAIGMLLTHLVGTKTASLADYQHVFSTLSGLAGIALVVSTFAVKETYCKSMRENTLLKPLV